MNQKNTALGPTYRLATAMPEAAGSVTPPGGTWGGRVERSEVRSEHQLSSAHEEPAALLAVRGLLGVEPLEPVDLDGGQAEVAAAARAADQPSDPDAAARLAQGLVLGQQGAV